MTGFSFACPIVPAMNVRSSVDAGWGAKRWWLAVAICTSLMVEKPAAGSTFVTGPEHLFQTWETEDGLPENSATAIVQAPDGYLWVGTFAGLTRFNGVDFTVFNPANTPQLPSEGVVNLHLDTRGWLWVSTYRGLVVYDWRQWRQLKLQNDAGDCARTFSQRPNGDLLITAFNGKLFQFSAGELTEFPAPPGESGQGYFGGVDEDGHWWVVQNKFIGRWETNRWVQMVTPPEVPRDAVGCAPSRDGGLWLVLGRELRKLNRGQETFRMTMPENPGGVWRLSEDSLGRVWIATLDRGVCRVSTNGAMVRWNAANGVSDRGRCIFEDREKNLWIGTSADGLMRVTPARFRHYDLGAGRQGMVVQSVAPDAHGGVWAGSYGRGVFHLDDTAVTNLVIPGGAAGSSYIQSVLSDRADRLWIGTYGSALWQIDNDRLRQFPAVNTGGNNVLALFEDSRQQIWMSGGDGVALFDGTNVHRLGPGDGLSPGAVTAFAEDSTGAIWLLHETGIFRREGRSPFQEIRNSSARPVRDIRCLHADADGSVWLGSTDRGLLRWKDGWLAGLDQDVNFPVTDIRGIVADDHGYLWMTSPRSIVRARRVDLHAAVDGRLAQLEIQVFDARDGLPKAEYVAGRQPNCARDQHGRLWFATSKGVVMTDPASLRLNDVPPPVQLEELSFYQTEESPLRRMFSRSGRAEHQRHRRGPFSGIETLPAGSRRIEIRYAGLSFVAPEKVHYQIWLDGKDSGWQDVGTRRAAYYHDLPPGVYEFRVRAANNDGAWNKAGVSLAFSVEPYFWQTTWFLAGVALALTSTGGMGMWWRVRQRHRRELTDLESARRQHADLAHASRVSLMGELSASMAHELNQPLTAILANAQAAQRFMAKGPPDLDEFREILKDIAHDTTRARDVIRHLRALVKKGNPDFIPVELNDTIQEVINLLHGDIVGRNVTLTLDLAPALPMILGNRIQLQQVMLNLIINAFDAMSNQPVDSRRVTVLTASQPGDTLRVEVRDRGGGIPSEKLEQLFQPFYTTKSEGMGMGLSVSRSIVQGHGGRLWAENNPGGGAIFCFTLPARVAPGEQE